MQLGKRGASVFSPLPWHGAQSLAALLPRLAPPRRALTVWLARGWEDVILTGLAELIQSGLYRYRFCTLDGCRVILCGRLGKRRVDVTALANWTCGEWDAWRDHVGEHLGTARAGKGAQTTLNALKGASPDERCALGTALTVLSGVHALRLGPVRLSLGAQARGWWRAWGGPRLGRVRTTKGGALARGAPAGPVVVAPTGDRPRAAAQAEHHCCHGLAREHYYRGRVKGHVHVLDLQSAYLIGLVYGQLPAAFDRPLWGPTPQALSEAIRGGAGCALVRLEGTKSPYFRGPHDAPRRAVGTFWAWLAEPELVRALDQGAVTECEVAWLWRHVRQSRADREMLSRVGGELKASGFPHYAALWRGVYAACVGGFAARAWDWKDVDARSPAGEWATWTAAGAREGTFDHYRAVGGRVQKRVYMGETAHALPLVYATVTAHVRVALDYFRSTLPPETVLATACDALWVTDAGLEVAKRSPALAPAMGHRWTVKDTFDEAWLDGKGRAVVRKGAHLFPLLPGVPAGVCLDTTGQAVWGRAQDWDQVLSTRPDRTVRRRRVRWDGGRLMRENDRPLRPTPGWEVADERHFPERLHLPYRPELVEATEDD
jgi:hypothetical protein